MTDQQIPKDKLVRHFRQIILWPLELMQAQEGAQIQKHWELLDETCAWHEVQDEFTGDPEQFQERHYSEFVTFMPFVQRFLYGEGRGGTAACGGSPIRVFRRSDVAKVRIASPDVSPEPRVFEVAHVDLYFFYDIDVTILALEIWANDLSLAEAQDTLFRFNRAYPTHWDEDGSGAHCPKRVEWLDNDNRVLAASNYDDRGKYLRFVGAHRSPAIASHWEFLLKPLTLHDSSETGSLRYRQLEDHRMPVMAFIAMDDAKSLTRGDFVRLAMLTAPGDSETLPYSDASLFRFEQQYCYDRYWRGSAAPGLPGTRVIATGDAFVMIGDQKDRWYVDRRVGMLEQFRHQYFLLYLIPRFHHIALEMLSDRLADALNRLDIESPDSVRRFRRTIRETLEIFLRFTHRYWFHDVSDQPQARELFEMNASFLGNDRLYAEIKEEIEDMNDYLDSDSLRRQASTVVRLTVVTTFGLIGTVVTGFLGMNLIAEAEAPLLTKIWYFAIVAIPVTALTFYTLYKSQRLSDFLDAMSNEKLGAKEKFGALLAVWKKR